MDDYLLVILLSVYCKACISALEELSIFLEAHGPVNVLILADGPDEKIEYLRNEFPENVSIFKYTVHDMKERLKTDNTPWLYGIARNGVVLKSYVCGNEYYELAYEGARASLDSGSG
ncbi:hypothetical protein D3C73_1322270 [compost metagenome]